MTSLLIVTERDVPARRARLAAEDEAGLHLPVLERLVAVHRHLACGQPRPAGRADAGPAGVWQRETGGLGRLEHGLVAGHPEAALPAVDRHADLGELRMRGGPGRRSRAWSRRRCVARAHRAAIDREMLDVNAAARAELAQRLDQLAGRRARHTDVVV